MATRGSAALRAGDPAAVLWTTPAADMPWLQAPLAQALQRYHGHALLVQAAAGTGVLPFMWALARGWLCEAPGEQRPCGACPSCHLFDNRSHPDLRLLLPETLRAEAGFTPAEEGAEAARDGKRKPSRQLRIDEVRAAVDWAVQTATRGRAKVLLLYPADALNAHAASALLKRLEEPPGQVRWLLGTDDATRLLPTVRSRCQLLRLALPPTDAAVGWLQQRGLRDAEVLLAAAGGQPLAALALAAAGVDGTSWRALPAAVAAGRAATLAGWPLARVIDALQKLCHDVLVASAGGAPRFFAADTLPAGAVAGRLAAWGQSLAEAARHADHPRNEALLVEALVAEGCSSWQDPAIEPRATAGAAATLGR